MVHGILVVDKPAGITSHDVVARARRRLGIRKIGHAGTLDPDATGVLVLCVGDATRLLEYVSAAEKAYDGEVVFGRATDTDDASGRVVTSASARHLRVEAVQAAARRFVGGYDQRVPAYSAVHIDGQRAYERARRGEAMQLPLRRVQITNLEVVSFTAGDEARAWFRVVCSTGTYIRSLCRDWGEALGLPAHMGALRRTRSGRFDLGQAVQLSEWENAADPARALLPMEEAVAALPHLRLRDEQCQRLAHGQAVPLPPGMDVGTAEAAGDVAVMAADGSLLAVGRVHREAGRSWIRPRKVFWKKGVPCK
ncbi:tRNA pseudouridine(55) synthase TruB [Alicyclobacillus kakegawensis]|uniref:tRNA pseudouridine(55) synthase TruB n=1 Tax=Alicyclobacillus kakegawensis TaxID=392012 RepID=UPI00082CD70E|nr:tRNA pseudouridine(55) synthase TruB [Alicyclobacillus kakegawensis]